TAMASFIARTRAASFPGGVFWFNMSSPADAAVQIAESAGPRGLGLPNYSELRNQDKINEVRKSWTESTPRLLVFDNLEDPGLLDELGPVMGIGGYCLLITSRRGVWSVSRGIIPIPLEPLDEATSIELLLSPRAN